MAHNPRSRHAFGRQASLNQLFGNGSSSVFPGFGEHLRRTHVPAQANKLTKAEIKEKKKQIAVRLLRKILKTKLRENFQEVKANAWGYYNYRT
jgi:hypothetical protein